MNKNRRRILLADDHRNARDTLCRELEDAGYLVQTAADGEDAILLCELDPPDVLIVDVDLPDIDGFEVCECVCRETRGSNLTVIITTEAADEMTRGYFGQMVDYVHGDFFFTKPCDCKLLVQLLDDLTEENAPLGPSRPVSPTHVVWPTNCFHAPISKTKNVRLSRVGSDPRSQSRRI